MKQAGTKEKIGKSGKSKTKYVYSFGQGRAEGDASMKNIIGGKGANLAEMTNLGIPVPPGFSLSTEVCAAYYENNKQYPAGLKEEVQRAVEILEKTMGKNLGDSQDPMLVSVRSGAAVSMPGMMDTVLNLGLNKKSVEGLAKKTGNPRLAWDSYRRFIQMFSNVVMDIKHDKFEEILTEIKKRDGVQFDYELQEESMKQLVDQYLALVKEITKDSFPEDPMEQLWKAVDAVFNSWNNPRAIKYRELNQIRGLLGTAVNVQAMVFGNTGDTSGTGVAFTRNPSNGEKKLYGEYLMNAQGEDVVAGIRTPHPIEELKEKNPKIYQEFESIAQRLEEHYRDMQDIEFTIQEGILFLLQTRGGKRTAHAAVKVAVDMVKEGMIDWKTALQRVDPSQLDQLLHPMIDPKAKPQVSAKGLPASPGAAVGQIVFNAQTAEEQEKKGIKVILVREETSPDDIGGMAVSEGILTARGGMTSHAAVVARGMGICCVAGCKDLVINEAEKTCSIGGQKLKEMDKITLNGSTGDVILGTLPLVIPELSGEFGELMEEANRHRRLRVRANADTPKDCKVARKFGAEGIGLCRTEHMFFEGDRIDAVREMILAEDQDERKSALAKILPYQKADFISIFEVMEGLPVTIRLLDPPLHEFIPHADDEIRDLARKANLSYEKLKAKAQALKEFNPMLGHRGCRLAVTYPEIYQMQVEAIFEAACEVTKRGVKVFPEVMIPLVGDIQELKLLRSDVEMIAKDILNKHNMDVPHLIGTMIEVPRAALTADQIATAADFFSFGTNDLTQMTYGFSRDDSGSFLSSYQEKGILDEDPFQVLDRVGVGQLVKMGVEKGRSVNSTLKIGICGEHGGNPSSVEFCHQVGLDYVSCSPYRIPVACLAAAQANLRDKE